VTQTIREHPIAAAGAAAVGAAGLGYAIVKGVQKAMSSDASDDEEGDADADAEDEDEDDTQRDDDPDVEASSYDDEDDDEGEGADDQDDQGEDAEAQDEPPVASEGREDSSTLARLGREGMSRLASRVRTGAEETRRAASEGFRRGRDIGTAGWDTYPLILGGLALLSGAALALLLPPTPAEDRLMGKAADRVNRRIRDTAGAILGQGKGAVGKAVTDVLETVAREAEREGLTPQRLGRKFKRIASQVQHVVSEAIE